jgi:DNA uptake protein ComE-like DNA-binding protein
MEAHHMKRILLPLAAMALTLGLGSAVRADDTSTAPATAPQASAPAGETSSGEKPAHHKHMAHHAMTVDLNSATKDQLEKLPGVDDATADKIIAARPFKSRGELTAKSILTKEEYSKIRSKITVKKAS